MKLRPFGNTGMNVSEIGLGAWQLANPDWGVDDKNEAVKIVQKSLEAGCNFFDTAPGYGGGRSEELLGQGLKSVRKDVIICTKFSYYNENDEGEWKAKHVRPVLEGSFKRLQTDYADILLLHNPPRELMDGNASAGLYAELEKLKSEGKIREYGVSLDWRIELENVLDTTKSKAAEVFFNAFADPFVRQTGFSLFNARIGFEAAEGRWHVAVFGRNLGDKLYAQTKVRQDPLVGNLNIWGAPRTYGVEVGVRL